MTESKQNKDELAEYFSYLGKVVDIMLSDKEFAEKLAADIKENLKKEDFNLYLKLCRDLRSEIDPVKERENLKGTNG